MYKILPNQITFEKQNSDDEIIFISVQMTITLQENKQNAYKKSVYPSWYW